MHWGVEERCRGRPGRDQFGKKTGAEWCSRTAKVPDYFGRMACSVAVVVVVVVLVVIEPVQFPSLFSNRIFPAHSSNGEFLSGIFCICLAKAHFTVELLLGGRRPSNLVNSLVCRFACSGYRDRCIGGPSLCMTLFVSTPRR